MVRVLRPASEDEMIAEYLRQEYASGDRYGPDIARCLALVDAPPELITRPDLTSEDDNRTRGGVAIRRSCASWNRNWKKLARPTAVYRPRSGSGS